MDPSDTTTPIKTLSTGNDGGEPVGQSTTQTEEQQQSSLSNLIDDKAEARAAGQVNTVQCFCGSADDDGNTIPCVKCKARQHLTCYYPDQENETLGEEFRHICINCATPTPFEDTTESTDEEEEESVDEDTSGYSEASASASASQYGEASTDGRNVPDVFLYMTQDVQYVPTSASGAGQDADDDTLRALPVNTTFQEFREQFFALSQIPLKWEDPRRLDKALEAIPLDQIHEQAQKAQEEVMLQKTHDLDLKDEEQGSDDWGHNDFIIIALMQWFKRDFFTWETNPPCPTCSSPTRAQGETAPSAQEREDSALVVELYTCNSQDCGASMRFPRYSDPWRLLETRRGRLAEWANCFGMLCRAVGARVRWTWNADKGHIWLEIYSEKKARWVSVDIFEVAWDKPLLYTEVWGQKMSYCIAFSADGPTDVTRRYVRSTEYQLPRHRCSEAELEDIIFELRELRRASMDDRQRARLEAADDAEERELMGYATASSLEDEEESRGRAAFKSPPSPLTSQTGLNLDKGKGIAVS